MCYRHLLLELISRLALQSKHCSLMKSVPQWLACRLCVVIDDILERMMDDSTASESKTLIGHSGPVYAVSFSPDRQYLLSSAEDGTGLWSWILT